MDKLNKLGNIEIDEKGEYAFFSVNPKIYPISVVYAAAYVMIDRAFILLDGDPKKEINVEIRKKENHHKLKELIISFNEELLNYATYEVQSKKNKKIQELLLQRVLLTNNPDYFESHVHEKKSKSALEGVDNCEDATQINKKLKRKVN